MSGGREAGWSRILVAMLLAAAVGCGSGDSTPPGTTSGGMLAGGAGDMAAVAGSAPKDPPATFTQVYDMLFPMTTNARCVACHSMPANDIANGNLQMGSDKATAYAALMGHASTSSRCMNRPLVVPKDPAASLLVQKMSATPPCGSRMPLGGNMLSEAQLAVLRGWVEAGARDD